MRESEKRIYLVNVTRKIIFLKEKENFVIKQGNLFPCSGRLPTCPLSVFRVRLFRRR